MRSLKAVIADGGRYESKLSILHDVAYSFDLDGICLTETCLNKDILDSKILPSGYNVYRKDRAARRGGGVLIAIKSSYSSCQVKLPRNCEELEVILVGIDHLLNDRKILFINCYRPHNDKHFIQTFKVLLNSIQLNKYFATIILGDFNLPNIIWFVTDLASLTP